MKKCCFCFSLRTGTLILSWLLLLTNIFTVTVAAIGASPIGRYYIRMGLHRIIDMATTQRIRIEEIVRTIQSQFIDLLGRAFSQMSSVRPSIRTFQNLPKQNKFSLSKRKDCTYKFKVNIDPLGRPTITTGRDHY